MSASYSVPLTPVSSQPFTESILSKLTASFLKQMTTRCGLYRHDGKWDIFPNNERVRKQEGPNMVICEHSSQIPCFSSWGKVGLKGLFHADDLCRTEAQY